MMIVGKDTKVETAVELKENRVTIMMPLSLLEAVDEYWHKKRLPSRGAAIRELIEKGMNDA